MTASYCAECGPNVKVDEDGCCAACGGNAMGEFADRACAAIAEVSRLKARLKDREKRIRDARKAMVGYQVSDFDLRAMLDLRIPLSKPRVAKLMRAGLSEVTAKTVEAIAVATRRPLSKRTR